MSILPFHRKRDGVHVGLGEGERSLIGELCEQLVALLETRDESDPAVSRLLPRGYADDDEANAEFRRLTVDDLTAGKIRNAEAIRESLAGLDARVPLTPALEQAWLRGLTDLRLTLASRLGITPEGGFDETDDSERLMMQHVFEWLGFVQESLVRAIDR